MKYKTVKRLSTPGHAHALTFSTYKRLPWFESHQICDLFLDSLEQARCRHQFDLWAYAIMPEHVHLLIMPRQPDYRMSTLLASIKRPVAFRARRILGTKEPRFWQPGGGYDRNLFEPRTVHHEIEYIHANPVRRGLCDSPIDYRYSSAEFWSGIDEAPIAMDKTLPVVSVT